MQNYCIALPKVLLCVVPSCMLPGLGTFESTGVQTYCQVTVRQQVVAKIKGLLEGCCLAAICSLSCSNPLMKLHLWQLCVCAVR